MKKSLISLAALGLMVALPFTAAKANNHDDMMMNPQATGLYGAFDLGFASLDHDIGATEVGGTSINLNLAVGYRAPLNMIEGVPLFWGGEASFGFGTLDESEEYVTTGSVDNSNGDGAATLTLTQTYTAEESFNITLGGDIGYIINPQALAFFRLGVVIPAGADATYDPAWSPDDTNRGGYNDDTAADYHEAFLEGAGAEMPAATYNPNNFNADDDPETVGAHLFIGVGGEYDLVDVMPGLSARGLFTFNLGDRSGFNFRVGAGYQF